MRNSNFGNYYRPSFFGGFRFFPPVIKNLLIMNGGIFLFTWLVGGGFTYRGIPVEVWIQHFFALWPLGTGFRIWQLFTYMFLHAGFSHLLFNMFALWMFGMELEHVFGSKKFLLYYVLCGLGGGLTHLLVGPIFGSSGPTIGASGAVYGVLLAFGLFFPDRLIFIYFLVPMKAKYFVLLYTLLELFVGVSGTGDNVAHFAHLGGALAGYIFILVDGRENLLSGWIGRLRSRSRVGKYFNEPRRADQRVVDAKFRDIGEESKSRREEEITQETIDKILDKISKTGYQNLTEEEKRILFEASNKLN